MGDIEEGSGSNSVINWWDLHATSNSYCSWNNINHPNPNHHDHSHNSSSCDDDLSAVSNNSTSFTSDHHQNLWTHLLLGGGSNEEVQNREEVVGEKFGDALSSKSIMFDDEAACDYLTKIDNSTTWEYNSNSFDDDDDKHHFNNGELFSHHHHHHHMLDTSDDQRLSKLSNLVTTWSIAPPHHPHLHTNSHFLPQTTNITSFNHSSISMDHSGNFPTYATAGALHHMKLRQQHHLPLHDHASTDQVPACNNNSTSTTINGYQNGSSVGDKINAKFYYGMPPSGLSSCTRNLTDVISFAGRLGRPLIGIHALKPTLKSSGLRSNNGRGQGSSTEVKKKRTEESSEAVLKKPKQDTSTASSTKVQAPKVKLSDRITTLQQIVSPFGKTDTASVLFEAIGCIKFLQEQIQLLSNSYMKTNSHKDGWGSMERNKEKGEGKVELRSRGLCLVPISCTPKLYTDNTSSPDYWTPPYRGCFNYRPT